MRLVSCFVYRSLNRQIFLILILMLFLFLKINLTFQQRACYKWSRLAVCLAKLLVKKLLFLEFHATLSINTDLYHSNCLSKSKSQSHSTLNLNLLMTSILLSKRVVKVNKMLMFLESRTTCHIKIITDQYHPVKKGVKVSS